MRHRQPPRLLKLYSPCEKTNAIPKFFNLVYIRILTPLSSVSHKQCLFKLQKKKTVAKRGSSVSHLGWVWLSKAPQFEMQTVVRITIPLTETLKIIFFVFRAKLVTGDVQNRQCVCFS